MSIAVTYRTEVMYISGNSFATPSWHLNAPVSNAVRDVAFLLMPGFTLLGFTNAIETLREANKLLGRQAYRWTTVSEDGTAVTTSSGVQVPIQASICAASAFDAVFVCADWDLERATTTAICRWLRKLDHGGAAMGAISGATYVLARADVIRGRRCTAHWEFAPSITDRFPDVHPTRRVFEVDRRMYTCAGGMGVFDLFIRLISAEHGKEIGDGLGMCFQLDRVRGSDEEQRSSPLPELNSRPRKLQTAIREMELTLEAPLSPEDIAQRVGVTTRHLQRLFRSHTRVSPARFYMDLRLRQARLLLQQTRMPVLEVAVAVGFSSHSHFSKRYRERYERTPQQERTKSHAAAVSVPPHRTAA
jgi:AraC family transcriptional regulator, glycine betaine-responsive activator